MHAPRELGVGGWVWLAFMERLGAQIFCVFVPSEHTAGVLPESAQ